MSNHVFAVALAALPLIAAWGATNAVANLPTVTVVATPITQEESVSKDGADSTTLSRDQLAQLNAQDLQTALRQVPGVTISRYAPIGSYGGMSYKYSDGLRDHNMSVLKSAFGRLLRARQHRLVAGRPLQDAHRADGRHHVVPRLQAQVLSPAADIPAHATPDPRIRAQRFDDFSRNEIFRMKRLENALIQMLEYPT